MYRMIPSGIQGFRYWCLPRQRLVSVISFMAGTLNPLEPSLKLIPMGERDELPAKKQIRTLVVDDFVSMHEALTTCLESLPGVEVVGTALNGKEALDKVPLLKPDLAVIDLQMPVMDGFQLMRRLRREYPQMRLVAV